jgi:hypothetical protein
VGSGQWAVLPAVASAKAGGSQPLYRNLNFFTQPIPAQDKLFFGISSIPLWDGVETALVKYAVTSKKGKRSLEAIPYPSLVTSPDSELRTKNSELFPDFPLYLQPRKETPFVSRDKLAQVAKLVDAPSSGGGAARCDGSNPFLGTKLKNP